MQLREPHQYYPSLGDFQFQDLDPNGSEDPTWDQFVDYIVKIVERVPAADRASLKVSPNGFRIHGVKTRSQVEVHGEQRTKLIDGLAAAATKGLTAAEVRNLLTNAGVQLPG